MLGPSSVSTSFYMECRGWLGFNELGDAFFEERLELSGVSEGFADGLKGFSLAVAEDKPSRLRERASCIGMRVEQHDLRRGHAGHGASLTDRLDYWITQHISQGWSWACPSSSTKSGSTKGGIDPRPVGRSSEMPDAPRARLRTSSRCAA